MKVVVRMRAKVRERERERVRERKTEREKEREREGEERERNEIVAGLNSRIFRTYKKATFFCSMLCHFIRLSKT